jgi:hypothetical protein
MDNLYRMRHTFCGGGYHWWHTEPQRWYWIFGVALIITVIGYLRTPGPDYIHPLARWFQDTPTIIYKVTGVIGALAGLIYAIHWGSHIIFWMLVGFGIGYLVLPLSILSIYFAITLILTVGFIFFFYWMVC